MAGSKAFAALETSDLNPFLFAGIGTEVNGSELTVLSLLARLGSDPWAEAGVLASMPKAASIDWLAERIGRIELAAHNGLDARAIASSLLLLLPSQAELSGISARGKADAKPLPRKALLTAVWIALALGLVASSIYAPPSGNQQAATQEPARK